MDVTTLGYKFDYLTKLFHIESDNETGKKNPLHMISEPSKMAPKCVFIPSRPLIHRMIKAIV